jgi:hypothetical protein
MSAALDPRIAVWYHISAPALTPGRGRTSAAPDDRSFERFSFRIGFSIHVVPAIEFYDRHGFLAQSPRTGELPQPRQKIVLSAIFAAIRRQMTASAKPYAAAPGSVIPIWIASGPFAVSTAPEITGQVPSETDMFISVIRRIPGAVLKLTRRAP